MHSGANAPTQLSMRPFPHNAPHTGGGGAGQMIRSLTAGAAATTKPTADAAHATAKPTAAGGNAGAAAAGRAPGPGAGDRSGPARARVAQRSARAARQPADGDTADEARDREAGSFHGHPSKQMTFRWLPADSEAARTRITTFVSEPATAAPTES